jgi:hypothetical protein
MTQQYLRNLSLIVANPAGKGIQLGDLRCVFEVHRGDTMTPNSCDVKVYNLSDATANLIYGPEFTQLRLQVGYGVPSASGQPPALQSIFQGSIRQVRLGREDQKNSYVAITAADCDEAYNFSALALTLAAGATPKDAVQALIAQMATRVASTPTGGTSGQKLTTGYQATLTSNGYSRGRTLYGLCRDEMRDIAGANDCKWFIQDGAHELVPNTGYVPAPPVLITPATGLIGVPEQTQNGLEVTVLMNPAIKIGRTIKLDSAINQLRYGLSADSVGPNFNLSQRQAKQSADGTYYVMRAEHTGDTRGTPWYTKLTCLATDITLPVGAVTAAAIGPVVQSPRDPVPRY